ncbi:MAG TPA: type II toxin-antitoxin system RelE/ParE family toxin [Clostridia bacterium]|mgnify:CR=1 FL=1|jgi:toxin ParE1/3/4|nr:type II toxin-antitoxin system RelE/ParE family toxin [Clostridia bacterium]HPY98254.1 type II toxin-antitoxin system RelE/ParE family toxin [Clostridia bacterium]HQC68188.1 type II toxin-antitoxin system RelE/ParE family toxin [Clostridia bacterium]
MKFKIIFSENAKKDLISIVRYISEELLEPVTAEKLSQRILKAIKSLNEFPMRHRLCDCKEWKDKGLRVLPVENYLVFYIPDEIAHNVKIYRVIYGKRDIENQLKDRIAFDE